MRVLKTRDVERRASLRRASADARLSAFFQKADARLSRKKARLSNRMRERRSTCASLSFSHSVFRARASSFSHSVFQRASAKDAHQRAMRHFTLHIAERRASAMCNVKCESFTRILHIERCEQMRIFHIDVNRRASSFSHAVAMLQQMYILPQQT